MAEAIHEATDYECPVCSDYFKQPKILLCGHDLCRECLVTCLHSNSSCPLCRRPMVASQQEILKTPEDNVNALPDDAAMAALVECAKTLSEKHDCIIHTGVEAVSFCFQCSDMLCSLCSEVHGKQKLSRHHVVEELSVLTPERLAANRNVTCPAHAERIAEHYCLKHKESLCSACVVSGHLECSEDILQLESKMEGAREELDRLLVKLDDAESALSRALYMINSHVTNIDKNAAHVVQMAEDIRNRFLDLVESIFEQYKGYIRDSSSQQKNKILGMKDKISSLHEKVISHKVAVKRVKQTISGSELFDMADILTDRINEIDLDIDACLPKDLVIDDTRAPESNFMDFKTRLEHDLSQLVTEFSSSEIKEVTNNLSKLGGSSPVVADFSSSFCPPRSILTNTPAPLLFSQDTLQSPVALAQVGREQDTLHRRKTWTGSEPRHSESAWQSPHSSTGPPNDISLFSCRRTRSLAEITETTTRSLEQPVDHPVQDSKAAYKNRRSNAGNPNILDIDLPVYQALLSLMGEDFFTPYKIESEDNQSVTICATSASSLQNLTDQIDSLWHEDVALSHDEISWLSREFDPRSERIEAHLSLLKDRSVASLYALSLDSLKQAILHIRCTCARLQVPKPKRDNVF